jgi:hypothetical protein
VKNASYNGGGYTVNTCEEIRKKYENSTGEVFLIEREDFDHLLDRVKSAMFLLKKAHDLLVKVDNGKVMV